MTRRAATYLPRTGVAARAAAGAKVMAGLGAGVGVGVGVGGGAGVTAGGLWWPLSSVAAVEWLGIYIITWPADG